MGPLVAWLVTIINRKFRRYSRRIQDSMGDITRVAKETLDAPRVIKVYNAQDYQNAQFEAVNEHNRRSHMRLVLTKGLSNPVVQMVTAIGSAFVLSIAIADAIHRAHDAWATCWRSSSRWSASRSRCAAWSASPGRCSRASRRARASSSCSMSRPSPPAATLHRAARARRHRVRRRVVLLSGRQGRQRCRTSACSVAAGRDARDRRPLRQRQVDARQSAAALLRRRTRARCASMATTCASTS